MKPLTVLALLAATSFPATSAQATITDKTPYYMCFAYTEDGMFFAGGDFNLKRAHRLLAANCGMPKSLSVVLLKTIAVRKAGKIRNYNSR